ncbi:hypothetical protein PHYBOEH_000622 [Phytophthora boehmeriae]|uniref:CLASP N-terminal domain-containing protein n=1 Tax=Phytophthora boehmeriae TaxID=109152 RepID=A0A8T1X888_9STRA|nr:hypothetical protein PHYBOEH_000622 [Phytophthora boehmeriae]
MEYSTALFASTTAEADQDGVQLEEILHVLEQNNSSDVEVKNALCKAVHFIETGSSETWDRCFGRLLLLLLDIATDKVYAWKVVKKLVETQRARAQMFFELLLQRLVDAMNDQVDLARHLMERILHDLVRNSSDKEQTLATLVTLISSTEPPALQVVLCLITLCLESCERGAPEETDFLLKPDVANGVLGALTRCLSHASSKARKNAVDCLVAYHFATKKDSTVMNKYLSAALDDNRRRLVGIFIDRANMERRHIGLSS